ncbi:DUF421 domain-containing protein [Peribacillus glennii]|uniref:DUF421 domain-containing protein n=1 Tax=Peribacillus glennii TaxID=2303991 RepID=A0A372LG95_9BACI|nr:DUF421 domain-containing protein [Peribacillus glennii]RFU65320.1 DUF421 domain-containing protein [Peribacillus glennii]
MDVLAQLVQNLPDWLDVIIRSLFFLFVLFFITKWLGKKQISQLSFFEYVTGITIGSIGAGVAMDSNESMFHGALSIITFTLVPYIAALISLKSKKFRDFIEGKATVFIKDGNIDEGNLKKEKYTADELLELLRKKNVFNVADVEFAILEPTGDLNVMLKKGKQPVTPEDLKLPVEPIAAPQIVIMDGELLERPLMEAGRNKSWLRSELENKGVSMQEVFLGQLNDSGKLTIDLYDGRTQSPTDSRSVIAILEKCKGDLESLVQSTTHTSLQKINKQNRKKLQKAINQLETILNNP